MDSYEMWWDNLAFISLVLVPWYLKLALSGLIELSVVLVFSPNDVLLSPKLSPRWALVSKTTELWGLEGTLPILSTKGGRGAC